MFGTWILSQKAENPPLSWCYDHSKSKSRKNLILPLQGCFEECLCCVMITLLTTVMAGSFFRPFRIASCLVLGGVDQLNK